MPTPWRHLGMGGSWETFGYGSKFPPPKTVGLSPFHEPGLCWVPILDPQPFRKHTVGELNISLGPPRAVFLKALVSLSLENSRDPRPKALLMHRKSSTSIVWLKMEDGCDISNFPQISLICNLKSCFIRRGALNSQTRNMGDGQWKPRPMRESGWAQGILVAARSDESVFEKVAAKKPS